MSTLGASRVATVDLDVPMFTGWYADVVLETGALPAVGSRLTLTVADLPLLGTVLRSGFDLVDQPHAVVVGGAGWDLPLDGRAYQSDAGVRLATVLRDLAKDTRETYAALPADRSIGRNCIRQGSTAAAPQPGRAMLLTLWRHGLLPPWWVRGDGLTVFGPRPTGAATGRADITKRDSSVSLKMVGVDSPAGFLPGLTIEGATIRRLVVKESAGSLMANVWTT